MYRSILSTVKLRSTLQFLRNKGRRNVQSLLEISISDDMKEICHIQEFDHFIFNSYNTN